MKTKLSEIERITKKVLMALRKSDQAGHATEFEYRFELGETGKSWIISRKISSQDGETLITAIYSKANPEITYMLSLMTPNDELLPQPEQLAEGDIEETYENLVALIDGVVCSFPLLEHEVMPYYG